MKSIRVDKLQNKTSVGLQIKVFGPGNEQQNQTENTDAHRDDHYIFFILTNGSGTLTVDLQDVTVTAGQLYYILPSQVHYRIKADCAEGWFLAVDISLISPGLRDVFERRLIPQVPRGLTNYELKQYSSLLDILHNEFIERQGDTYYLQIIHTLVRSFLAMAASTYSTLQITVDKYTRLAELTYQFRALLSLNVHSIKSPSAYAAKLNISTGYLNEAIKQTTGSTVSYWIQQEIFSEAKRLIYHSEADIKQIAYQLGYSDYSYFVRSFKKASGLSPLKFRMLNRL